MAKKPQTNTEKLIALIKENDKRNPLFNAILRERIVMIMEMTRLSIDNEPHKWETSFISPNLYKALADGVQLSIGFDNN